jgi:hypothetical protein
MRRSAPDPLPGDFDEELESLGLDDVQAVAASHDWHLVAQFTLDGDDTAALQKIAPQSRREARCDRQVADPAASDRRGLASAKR